MLSEVVPFPIRRQLHQLDCMRCEIQAAGSTAKKRTMLWRLVQQHEAFLRNAGVAEEAIKREIRDLVAAISTPLMPNGGLKIKMAA
jgi:hypothetical protein